MITPSSPRPSHQCYCYLGCAVLVLRSWRWASSFGEVRVGSVGSPPSIAFSDIFRHQTQSSKSLRLFLVCPSPAREAQKLKAPCSSCCIDQPKHSSLVVYGSSPGWIPLPKAISLGASFLCLPVGDRHLPLVLPKHNSQHNLQTAS